MVSTVLKVMFAGLLASFIVSMFVIGIDELNDTYPGNIDTTNLSTMEKLDEFDLLSTELKNRVTEDTKVATEESVSSFFTNAFTISKFIITGGPIAILTAIIKDFLRTINAPAIFFVFISSLLIATIAIAVVTRLTGVIR